MLRKINKAAIQQIYHEQQKFKKDKWYSEHMEKNTDKVSYLEHGQ